jgi:hypothetical protein
MVFWRETGAKDEDEEVEALEGACSIATDMAGRKRAGEEGFDCAATSDHDVGRLVSERDTDGEDGLDARESGCGCGCGEGEIARWGSQMDAAVA